MNLKERLRKVESSPSMGEYSNWYRNPDGPEAADRIDALEKALREWLDALGEMEQKTRGIMPDDARLYEAEKRARAVLEDNG